MLFVTNFKKSVFFCDIFFDFLLFFFFQIAKIRFRPLLFLSNDVSFVVFLRVQEYFRHYPFLRISENLNFTLKQKKWIVYLEVKRCASQNVVFQISIDQQNTLIVFLLYCISIILLHLDPVRRS